MAMMQVQAKRGTASVVICEGSQSTPERPALPTLSLSKEELSTRAMLTGVVQVNSQEETMESFFMKSRPQMQGIAQGDSLGVDHEYGHPVEEEQSSEEDDEELPWVEEGDEESKRVLREWIQERDQQSALYYRTEIENSRTLTAAFCAGENPVKAAWIRACMAERERLMGTKLAVLDTYQEEHNPGHLDYVSIKDQLEGPLLKTDALKEACNERLLRLDPSWKTYAREVHGIRGVIRGINTPRDGHYSVAQMRALLAGTTLEEVKEMSKQVAGKRSGTARLQKDS